MSVGQGLQDIVVSIPQAYRERAKVHDTLYGEGGHRDVAGIGLEIVDWSTAATTPTVI
jgi:hypothetical protein